jgi:hypothetical protein
MANGGALALVGLGLTVGGFTNRSAGLALILLGILWWLVSVLKVRCIKFAWSRLVYRLRVRAGVHGALEAVVIPGSATGSRDLRFTTDTQEKRFIDTGERNTAPVGLRFLEPCQQLVTHVPSEVRTCGRLVLRIEEFHEHGFIIGSQLPGVDVAAEVSYQGRKPGEVSDGRTSLA